MPPAGLRRPHLPPQPTSWHRASVASASPTCTCEPVSSPSRNEPALVAERLGLTDLVVDRLRARGGLERLALSDREIRERLFSAHLAFARARARRVDTTRLGR